jgi:predicted amidophosphoribosyltransferase
MSGEPWPTQIGLGSLPEDELASRCQALIDDPVLAAVMNQLDAEAVDSWRRSTSAQQREDAWHRMIAVADIRRILNHAIENLKMRTVRDRRQSRRAD